MNEKAKKYVTMFRQVKIASAATVDAGGHPQSRIINIMIANEDGMYIVTSKGKPFYKQLAACGEIALSAMCPECQSLKFTGRLRIADKKWVDEEVSGFFITDACIGCGRCAEECPQKCITPGESYQIVGNHCLRCGLCQETCPVGAIINLND